MLQEKWKRFEDLGLSEEEQLTGAGWIPSFTKTYNLQECQQHGEATFIDPVIVAVEQE